MRLRRVLTRLPVRWTRCYCVRRYVAYSRRRRDLDEMMSERGQSIDHSTVCRWALKLLPIAEKTFRWMDAIDVKNNDRWTYVYRAVDKDDDDAYFLLRVRRKKGPARRYFEKVISFNGKPRAVTADKSGANLAALNDTIANGQMKASGWNLNTTDFYCIRNPLFDRV